ncbi:MAG TPA: ABC transporter permease, partial [Gemmatimonadaceae bacterium]|nr:ABC transporter permease [Gemmatimonadaceae bacterium]
MDRLMGDLRFTFRGLTRAPGFFVAAVAIVGLGIGMSVAMFTVFRTVLIRRLPVVDQDHIAVMWTYRTDPKNEFTLGTKELSVVRQKSRTMRDIAAIAHWPATASPFAYGERSIELNRGMVTGNFFSVLGAKPALGRLFTPDDDEVPGSNSVGAHRALVLSYRAWRQTFGGDSTVIGRHLIEPLVRTDYEIIGVAPPGLEYPSGVGYWIPMWQGWQSTVSAFAVARLAPGATVSAAANEYLAIERRLQPGAEFGGVHAATFTETILGNVRPVLATLTAAVSLLLLIACMNVGNLMLLRGTSRVREIAVRRAIGASYVDIVRQLLVETLAITATGGVVGWVIATALLHLLVVAAPR